MATNAKYKIYNGSAWVEYHFATNAGQVSTTSARKFLTTSVTVNSNTAGTTGAKITVGENDAANIEIDGAHITGQASAVSGSSLQYTAASDSIAVALGKLDKAAKDAYDHVPSNCLTYGNDGNFGTQNPDLVAIEALSGTTGFLTKTDENTWALDTTTYVPTTRRINNKALSTNITLAAGDIPLFGIDPQNEISVSAKFMALDAKIEGIGQPICINVDGTFAEGVKNALLKSTENNVTISIQNGSTTEGLAKIKYNIFTETTELVTSFSIGDVVYIRETDYPDRWVSAVTLDTQNLGYLLITFSKLETYNMTWAAITGTPTTIAGYGITDAKIENGTITLGSNSITPITSHQSLANYVTLNTSQEITGDKRLTGTVKVGEGAFYIENDDNSYKTEIKQATSGTHEVTANRTITLPNKSGVFALLDDVPTVNVQSTTPSSAKAGDIWIQTA